MKLKTNQTKQGAFTLIEMIGVLAVIAILAAVLIPKVFEAINNSRINNAAMSCDTVKAAIADHYSKWGGLNIDGSTGTGVVIPGASIPYLSYDAVLLKEQFLDKLFVTKIGDGVNGTLNTHVELIPCPALGATVDTTQLTGYSLSGNATTNECSGSYVIQAVITGATEADAQALSQRVDGNNLSTAALGNDDIKGRVKYAKNSPTTIYVYLTHR
jgi:prepilin-type N-terminal cleavage/methylation domain-containing protein